MGEWIVLVSTGGSGLVHGNPCMPCEAEIAQSGSFVCLSIAAVEQ